MEYQKGVKISKIYTADNRRDTFDVMNWSIVESQKKIDCVFIGDSITEYWDVQLFFRELGVIVNRGICGDVVYGVASRFDVDVLQLKPKVCVLMIGVNDIYILDDIANNEVRKKGKYEDVFAYTDNVLLPQNIPYYKNIVEKCIQNSIKLILCSVTPNNHDFRNGKDYRNYYICKLNDELKKIAKKNNISYVDYVEALIDENGLLSSSYSLDRLHPNPKGYAIMERILKPCLEKELKND